MRPEVVALIGIAVMFVLIFMRIWIGVAMIIVGFLGYAYLEGWRMALSVAAMEPYAQVASYNMSVIALFMLMGSVVSYAGVGGDLYGTAYKWMGGMPGGLAIATVSACAGFSAICGSSLATAATMGKVAIPEMKKYKYDLRMASGCVAAGGSMGILIPPSLGFILYGILCEQSIGKLFMAGIIPGILQAVFYIILIWITCRVKPSLGPSGSSSTLKEKIFSLKNTWAVVTLFLLVMGGIYMGIFTPTEAGAIGAFGSIVISFVARKLTWTTLSRCALETVQITAIVLFMVVGAFILMRFLALSGLPSLMGELVTGLAVPRVLVLVAILVMYIILGCFMDAVSMIILTLPIIFPTILALGFNPIWFGVITVRMIEIGEITPPFGLNVFTLAAVSGVPIGTVFRGVIPFVLTDFCHVALLVAVPQLSLFIPNRMLK
jgi:tripartite ATP-independent transporter DctM subunit